MSETLDDRMVQHAADALRKKGYVQDADELLRVWGLPTVQGKRAETIRTVWTVGGGVIVWLCAMIWIVDTVAAATGDKGLGFLSFIIWFVIGIACAFSFAIRRGWMD